MYELHINIHINIYNKSLILKFAWRKEHHKQNQIANKNGINYKGIYLMFSIYNTFQ